MIGGQKFDFKDEHVEIDDSTITIDNNEVVVGLSFNNPEKIELFIFQNYTRDTGEQQKKERRGIARCALLFLINKLIKTGKITDNSEIIVDSPTPLEVTDKYIEDKEKLVTFYNKNMGFEKNEDGTLLPQNVKELIERLNRLCS